MSSVQYGVSSCPSWRELILGNTEVLERDTQYLPFGNQYRSKSRQIFASTERRSRGTLHNTKGARFNKSLGSDSPEKRIESHYSERSSKCSEQQYTFNRIVQRGDGYVHQFRRQTRAPNIQCFESSQYR